MVSQRRSCDSFPHFDLVFVSFVGLILRFQGVESIVTISSSSHATPQSSNANISCSVTEDAFIEWTNPNGQAISSDRSQRLHVISTGDKHDLIITNVQKDDKGMYQCRSASKAVSITLHVEYPPKIITSQSTNRTQWTSYEDQTPVHLKCKFDGFPVPRVEISKDNKPITNGVSQVSGSLTYSFHAKTIDDIGFYACKATNSQGEDTYYIDVSKKGSPGPPTNITLHLGCDYVRVEWAPPYSDRGSPVTSYRIELLSNANTIRGKNLSSNERKKMFFKLEQLTGYNVRMSSKNLMGSGAWETHSFNTTTKCFGQTTRSSIIMLFVFSILCIVVKL